MLTLERILAEPPLMGRVPQGFQFSEDGQWLAFLRGAEQDSQVLDLWRMNLGSGHWEPWVRVADLIDPKSVQLSEAERMANERKRQSQGGITQLSWCASSGVLFPLSGDLYLAPLSGGVPRRLTLDGAPKLDPRGSPLGRFVSFVRNGELVLLNLESGQEQQITRGASASRSFGLAEFVAQEEMNRLQGYFWSPDERFIIYAEVDESPVPLSTRVRIYADRTELTQQHYPVAGSSNANVQLYLYELATGQSRPVPLAGSEGYIARIHWSPDSNHFWVQWQSRDQKCLELWQFSAPFLTPRRILSETDPTWVELHQCFAVLKNGRLIWGSERSGSRQLYLIDPAQPAQWLQLTQGIDPVGQLVGVDEAKGRLYYTRQTDQARQQHLFSSTLEGTEEKSLTQAEGWHEVLLDKHARHFVDSYSSFECPSQIQVWPTDGQPPTVLDQNPCEELKGFSKEPAQWVEVKAEDGTPLNGLLLPPLGVKADKRYPVLVYVYGGPHAQLVVQRFARMYPFFLYLAQQGYGVFMLDNRGSGGRDWAFTRALEGRLGRVELEDQKKGAEYLKSVPWVDPERIGVWGWSYGGFLSLMAILDPQSPFKAAAAIAPVTDWTLYDTHYTERYLGMPQSNPEAYQESSALAKAKSLKRPLLVAHGMADDNVLFEHSLRLIETLQEASVPFEMMVYPGRAHGLQGRGTMLHLLRTLWGFFQRTI